MKTQFTKQKQKVSRELKKLIKRLEGDRDELRRIADDAADLESVAEETIQALENADDTLSGIV